MCVMLEISMLHEFTEMVQAVGRGSGLVDECLLGHAVGVREEDGHIVFVEDLV